MRFLAIKRIALEAKAGVTARTGAAAASLGGAGDETRRVESKLELHYACRDATGSWSGTVGAEPRK